MTNLQTDVELFTSCLQDKRHALSVHLDAVKAWSGTLCCQHICSKAGAKMSGKASCLEASPSCQQMFYII